MELKDFTDFAMAAQVGYVATVEGKQPRVRAFLMWFADATGFYFHTGASKKVYSQLALNPLVEVCFFNPDPEKGGMMRVSGEVEFLDDRALKARLIGERTFLQAICKGPDDPLLAVFRIPHGEATFWTMADNLREDQAPRVSF